MDNWKYDHNETKHDKYVCMFKGYFMLSNR